MILNFDVVVSEVIRSGQIVQGEVVGEFEKKVAKYIGVNGAAATSTGTSALHLALLAMGIKKGDPIAIPGFVCSAFLGILAIKTMQPYLVLLSVALAGSCLGFLPYNLRYKKPAVIFLGDAGSTFMGFMLAGMILMGGWGGEDPIKAYAMPMLIMGIFIFDMVYTTVSGIASKKVINLNEWLEFTGKDHLHHRLTSLGLSAKQTVFLFTFLLHHWV